MKASIAANPSPDLSEPDRPKPDLSETPHGRIAAACAGARVVSFDVFDTLFYRLVPEPETVFDLIGERFGIFDFRSRRMAAQSAAFGVMHARGEGEVTLDGIYECLPDLGVPAGVLKRAEWDLELHVLRPNPEVTAALDACRARGQTCVVTSDMYLPRAFFDELFARHGVVADRLFISADEQVTKRDDGALFRRVAAVTGVPPAEICHVGDNPVSDVERGREQGLQTCLYGPAAPVGAAFAAAVVGRDIRAASVAGLSRAQAFEPGRSTWWRYGFAYGGPAILAFLRWLRERAERDRLDRLLFLSRDGYTLHALWDHAAIPATYFRCSRVALGLAAIDETNFDANLPMLLSGIEGLRLREVFERIAVPPPGPELLGDFALDAETRYEPALATAFWGVVNAWRWQILKVCRECRRGLHAYCRALDFRDGERVGIVDVGWSGSTQDGFVTSVGALFDLDTRGYYFCLQDGAGSRRPHLAMDAMIDDRFAAGTSEQVYTQRAVVELFFSAPHDSVIGYRLGPDGRVRFTEDPGRGADPRAREIAGEIDRGARAFVETAESFLAAHPVEPDQVALATPLIRLATQPEAEDAEALGGIWNFDSWGSSTSFRSYLARATEDAATRGDTWPAGLAALQKAASPVRPDNAPKPATG